MSRTLNIPRGSIAGFRNPAGNQANKPKPPLVPGLDGLLRAKQQHISTKQLMVLTSQLSTMLAAGCDLCASLDALAKQQTHPYLKKVMKDLSQSVQSGRAFSQALAEHPHVFSPLYVSMVRAGETSGTLRAMLLNLQNMLRNQARIASTVRGALMYPAILMTVALIAVAVMTSFVLPRFAQVFRSSGSSLPTITLIVLNVSEFVGNHFIAIFAGIFALFLLVMWAARMEAVRPQVHAWSLKVPLIGNALRLSYVVRSIETLGALIKSGLPVADGLLLVRDLMPNVHYQKFFSRLHEHITEGKPIAPDFEKTSLFPPMVAQMIGVGEQTGTLPAVCIEISSLHEEELNDRIKILTTALEPIIIVVLGGFVAVIAISVILPMFRLSSTVK